MGNKKGRLKGHLERSVEVERTATILEKRGYHVTKVTDKTVSIIAPVCGAVIQLRDQRDLQVMEKRGLISLQKVKYHGPAYAENKGSEEKSAAA